VDRAREFWERSAAQYDRFVTGFFGRPMARAVELTAEGVAGLDRVLEVAAGTGLLTAAMAPHVGHVVATDYAENMIVRLEQRLRAAGCSNVETARRDIYALDYPPASFDAVVAGNVLHLVPDLDRALRALSAMLRPGGKFIAPTFAHGQTWTSRCLSRLAVSVLGQPVHHRFTTATLSQALERHGLRVIREETISGAIPIAYVETVWEAPSGVG
jgi:ubiquinone/menaquinone biosynthesis C-methylase UbiE